METPLTKNITPGAGPLGLKEYEAAGGYRSLRKAIGKIRPEDIQQEVIKADLRGRGGAGFPTGKKWGFVPAPDGGPRYLCINADEMEPGTFKDRLLLEGDPHQMIEGAIVSAYAIGAGTIYLFIRREYVVAQERLAAAIHEAYLAGYLGDNILGSNFSVRMILHASAGRYMFGEETGLLNALEGRRATPRAKPPYPQTSGLWGKPTVVNNVETICCVHHIVNNGADWFRSLSANPAGGGGTKIYGVSGKVKNPGLWELPMGTKMGEVLELAGGMQEGLRFRGALPGGASTGFLTGQHLDVRLDFDSPAQFGSRMGTGTMIVMDDKTCPVGMVHNMMTFFMRESCGWCTPCRDGLPWTTAILYAIENGQGQMGDLEILREHTNWLGPGRTFCALAPGAMEPLGTAMKYFREDFERHIKEKRCPWKGNT